MVSDDKVFAAMKRFFSEIFTQPLDQNIPSQNRSESTQGPTSSFSQVRSLLLSGSGFFLNSLKARKGGEE